MFAHVSGPSRPLVEHPLVRLVGKVNDIRSTEDSWYDGHYTSITKRAHQIRIAIEDGKKVLADAVDYDDRDFDVMNVLTYLERLYQDVEDMKHGFADEDDLKLMTELPTFSVQGAYNPYVSQADTEEDLPPTPVGYDFLSEG